MRQTKIVATISDKRCDKEFIQSLFNAGMNVARINTAHVSSDSAMVLIRNIRAVSKSIAILIDTKGPEVRTCTTQNELSVTKGETITLSHKKVLGPKPHICVNYDGFVSDIQKGNKILIDDGDIEITVTAKKRAHLVCQVANSGTIKKQ